MEDKIQIVQYKWAGEWGPFKIKIPCGECAVTENIINDVLKNDFPENDKIDFEVRDWFPNWFSLLVRGGFHAPVVTVNGKVIFQGQAIDRGFLASVLRKEFVKYSTIPAHGVLIYSKENCKYCVKAKDILKENNFVYTEKDVVKDPLATSEIFFTLKSFSLKTNP